jgi:hypothetical protein
MRSDIEDGPPSRFTHISTYQGTVDKLEDSQCETVCDEDMTEEEYDLNGDVDEVEVEVEDEEGDEENLTDGSSTCSARNSEDTDDETSQSCPSQEIQLLTTQFPEISDHFQILSKIGEGQAFPIYPY